MLAISFSHKFGGKTLAILMLVLHKANMKRKRKTKKMIIGRENFRTNANLPIFFTLVIFHP